MDSGNRNISAPLTFEKLIQKEEENLSNSLKSLGNIINIPKEPFIIFPCARSKTFAFRRIALASLRMWYYSSFEVFHERKIP